MSFAGLAPAVAWVLAAMAAAAVVGLYLLRPPPQRVAVPSLVLWQRIAGVRRRLAQRWRWWLSLLLALVIATLLALAAMRPEAAGSSTGARDLVVVVDNSITMNAMRSDGKTRFEHAVAAARSAIRKAPPGTRFLVSDTLRLASTGGFVQSEAALRLLDSMEAGNGTKAWFPELELLPEAARERDVLFFTDGVTAVAHPAAVTTVSSFERAPNLGITAFNLRPLPTDATRYEAFVEVGNAATVAVEATVTVSGPGRDPRSKPVRLPPRGFATVSVPVADFGGGALQATVESADDRLALDDTAYAFLPFNRSMRVALVTSGNAPLEAALRLDPRLRLTVLSPPQYAAKGGYDAYVFDRFAPAAPPLAPVLAFRPPQTKWLAAHGSSLAAPVAGSWLADHPVLDNVSLADVQIDRAVALQGVDAQSGVLARTPSGQALVIASDRAPRRLAVGFSGEDSNFASQASFPVFLANAMQWLTEEIPPHHERLGTLRVPLEKARVSAMNAGALQTRELPGATGFTVSEPDFLTVESSAGRMRVLVNVLDPAVTDINASGLSPAPASSSTAEPHDGTADALPLAWWLLLAAAAALVAEWLTYHRRVTV